MTHCRAAYHRASQAKSRSQNVEKVGGCVFCNSTHFTPSTEGRWDEQTAVLCSQCEREHHVGCLRKHRGIHLNEEPPGELPWFGDLHSFRSLFVYFWLPFCTTTSWSGDSCVGCPLTTGRYQKGQKQPGNSSTALILVPAGRHYVMPALLCVCASTERGTRLNEQPPGE